MRILLLFHDHSLSGGGQGEGNQKIINLSTHGTFTHGRKNLRKAIRTEFTRWPCSKMVDISFQSICSFKQSHLVALVSPLKRPQSYHFQFAEEPHCCVVVTRSPWWFHTSCFHRTWSFHPSSGLYLVHCHLIRWTLLGRLPDPPWRCWFDWCQQTAVEIWFYVHNTMGSVLFLNVWIFVAVPRVRAGEASGTERKWDFGCLTLASIYRTLPTHEAFIAVYCGQIDHVGGE